MKNLMTKVRDWLMPTTPNKNPNWQPRHIPTVNDQHQAYASE